MKLQYWHWMVFAVWIAVCSAVLYRGHQVTEGRKAFERLGCPACHFAGGAPSLEHVARKYDRPTLVDFITDPETIYVRVGHRPLNPGYSPMPRLDASHRDIEVLSYFLSAQH